ncbi:PaaX family transcriptional regulator C-terminal domain-containing protein [Acinetobacter sp. CFCC 10889]|uniref:PaaX family transcriptional regulator C-terminal domain-containing protein n=1 Tax=Acinetobacter sp. CFCC 10889 TaxID=1775557 RepID=UPI001D194A38|nr:PaaX family transcriptional regulator C-terminal domain-containing protein [Acinetobacter sp. CFCC 10889]
MYAMTALNAKSFIIDLLLASGGQTLSIKQLLQAAKLLDIRENNIRVAVTRLCAENKIEAVARGQYKLSANTEHWGSIIIHRNVAIRSTKIWNQHYIAVLTITLGRTDRTALNQREKILHRAGFRELEIGFFIRPDNLSLDLNQLQHELIQQGLEKDALFLQISDFDQAIHRKIPTLWESQQLNQRYQKYHVKISQWLTHYQNMDIENIARESFLLGRETIALMLTDPLLPSPFVDEQLRSEFFKVVLALDHIGQETWHKLNH